MGHGGKKCGEYWREFINDRERLLFESERILAQYEGTTIEKKYEQEIRDIPQGIVSETKLCEVKTRVNQNVFRQIVLANYDGRCALTGIDLTELLVASHIIPWADNEQERLNPENGICLSSLYDKAFDKGLISFTNDHRVIFSVRLKANVGKAMTQGIDLSLDEVETLIARGQKEIQNCLADGELSEESLEDVAGGGRGRCAVRFVASLGIAALYGAACGVCPPLTAGAPAVAVGLTAWCIDGLAK